MKTINFYQRSKHGVLPTLFLALCLGICSQFPQISIGQEDSLNGAGTQKSALAEQTSVPQSKPTPDVSFKTATTVKLPNGEVVTFVVTPLKDFKSNRTLVAYPWLVFHARKDGDDIKLDETISELSASKKIEVSQDQWPKSLWSVYYDQVNDTFSVEFHIEFFPAAFTNFAVQLAEQDQHLNRLTENVPGKEIAVRPISLLPEEAEICLYHTEHGKVKLIGSSDLQSLIPDVCVGSEFESYHRVIVEFVSRDDFLTFLERPEEVEFQMSYSYEGFDSSTITTVYEVDETKVADQVLSLFNDGHDATGWTTKLITQSKRDQLDSLIKTALRENTTIEGKQSAARADYLIKAFYQNFNPISLLTEKIEWEELDDETKRQLAEQFRADFERTILQEAQKYAEENENVSESLTDEIEREINASHVDAQTGFSGFYYLFFYGDIGASEDSKTERQIENRQAVLEAAANKMGIAVEHLKDSQQFKVTAVNLYRVKHENAKRLAKWYRQCSVYENTSGLEKTDYFTVAVTSDAVKNYSTPKNVPTCGYLLDEIEKLKEEIKEFYKKR